MGGSVEAEVDAGTEPPRDDRTGKYPKDAGDEVEEEVRDAYDALKKKAGAFKALPKEAQARMLREACFS